MPVARGVAEHNQREIKRQDVRQIVPYVVDLAEVDCNGDTVGRVLDGFELNDDLRGSHFVEQPTKALTPKILNRKCRVLIHKYGQHTIQLKLYLQLSRNQ